MSAQRFTRVIVTLPCALAEAFGSALVELGAFAVEERPGSEDATAEVVLTLPDGEPVEPWQELCQSLSQAFVEEAQLSANRFAVRCESCTVDYHEGWLKHLTLVRLTPTLVLAPVGDPTPTPDDSERLVFVPHPSFGDGSHVTTRLAATAVERFCRAHAGTRLLDVGTGNGVLSLVAAKSSATALGLDIDDDAVAMARDNSHLNQVSNECQFSTASVSELTEQFAVVVANLEPLVQLELAQGLAARVLPAGTLYLTGFLEEQAAQILEPYLELGFTMLEQTALDGYVLLGLCAREERHR